MIFFQEIVLNFYGLATLLLIFCGIPQIVKIYIRRSGEDISVLGLLLNIIAISILLHKAVVLREDDLIVPLFANLISLLIIVSLALYFKFQQDFKKDQYIEEEETITITTIKRRK